MRFKVCEDFFRKGNQIFLTNQGVEKVRKTKLTGTKIPKFFKLQLLLPDEEIEINEIDIEEEKGRENKSLFSLWAEIIHFPFVKKRDPKKEEKYRVVEEKIKVYVENQIGKKFFSHPAGKYDVFEDHKVLGGVPDGEEIDTETGRTLTILEIKTITDIRNNKEDVRFNTVPISYQLQIALYLYLRGIDVGYVCICYLKPENWSDLDTITLDSSLSQYLETSEVSSGIIQSYVPEIGDCEYEFQIIEAYCNDFVSTEDNEILLFKIRVNMSKYEVLINKIRDWFLKHERKSPEIDNKELGEMISKNKDL